MANIDDTGTTQPITDVPITTEPTTAFTTQPVTTSTEPATTAGTSPTTNAGTNNTTGQEKFEYEEVKKAMEALDGEFRTFAEALKSANDFINDKINVSPESAVYGEGVGSKFLNLWNENASTFGDFYDNFEGWSKLVTLISSNNAEFEVTARTTGGTMDDVSSRVAGLLAAVPTEPSGSVENEVILFVSNHGLINSGAAWMTAFMVLSPESQSKINGMIRIATDEAEKYIKDYGLVNSGAAYNNLDKAVRDIIDKRIKEKEENLTAGLTETTESPAETTESPAETTESPAETTESPAETTESPAETTDAPVETSSLSSDDEVL